MNPTGQVNIYMFMLSSMLLEKNGLNTVLQVYTVNGFHITRYQHWLNQNPLYRAGDAYYSRQSSHLTGIALGIVLNVVGIVKLIDWMADRNTSYRFERRQLRPEDQ